MSTNNKTTIARCFIIALIIFLIGCYPFTVNELRTSRHSGRIFFTAYSPIEDLHKAIFNRSSKCLYYESCVVAQNIEYDSLTSNITFSFTGTGAYLNIVTIDMEYIDDNQTNVKIFYAPNINGQWQHYAEKVEEWALQQSQDCEF